MESDTKVQRNVSVVENLEDRISTDHVMRMLTIAWLIPAIALLALGLSAITDFALIDEANQVHRLNQVRASVILLSLLTVLVGSIWALRSWDLLPNLSSIKDDSWRLGPKFHCLALLVAVLAIAAAPFTSEIAAGAELILWWTSAVAACIGGAILPRWLRQIGEFSSQSIAIFAGIIVYQLTIGWLHMLNWTTVGSVVLVTEGMTMAVVAVAAAIGIPAFGRRRLRIAEPSIAQEPEVEITLPEQEEVTPIRVRRSAEEPAAVH